jgi:ACR3 family arsenite efflux pump ArsB
MSDQTPNYFVWGLLIAGGVAAALTVIFIVLRANRKIEWSWWWVFSPVLIYIGIPLILLAACAVYGLIKGVKYPNQNKR